MGLNLGDVFLSILGKYPGDYAARYVCIVQVSRPDDDNRSLTIRNELKTDRPRCHQQERAGPYGFVACLQGGVEAFDLWVSLMIEFRDFLNVVEGSEPPCDCEIGVSSWEAPHLQPRCKTKLFILETV